MERGRGAERSEQHLSLTFMLPCIHPAASGSCAVFSPLLFCSKQPNTLCTGTKPHSGGVPEAVTQKQPMFYSILSGLWTLLPARRNKAQSLICLCLPVLTGSRPPDLWQPYPDRDLLTALFLHGCSGGCSARSYVPSESSGACTSITSSGTITSLEKTKLCFGSLSEKMSSAQVQILLFICYYVCA